MAVLGLRFCARAFSSCGKRGPLFIAVHGPLTIAASLVAEHRLQTHRLSSCGSRAQLLRGMWDLPRPGLEPASPALAGRLSTTAPPGKPHGLRFYNQRKGAEGEKSTFFLFLCKDAAGKRGARGRSCPRYRVSFWDGPPSEESIQGRAVVQWKQVD